LSNILCFFVFESIYDLIFSRGSRDEVVGSSFIRSFIF